MKLTEHFTLEELTFSQDAVRHGIDNTPPADVMDNLRMVASALEDVRMLLAAPVIVTSGYRCERLNAIVRGSATSAHVEGLAADIIAPRFGSPAAVAQALQASGLVFDQIILEFGRWVHLGVHPVQPRGQVLTAVRRLDGRTEYLPGIKP